MTSAVAGHFIFSHALRQAETRCVYCAGGMMGETPRFFLLTLIATLIFAACILRNGSPQRARRLARAFYFLAVMLSLATLLWIVLIVNGIVPQTTKYDGGLYILLFRGWLVIGAGISSAAIILLNASRRSQVGTTADAACAFVNSPYLLRGLCFSVTVSFLCTELGKLHNDAFMRQFFLQSGYAVWFLYFIIIAETLGSFGLFIHRTIVPAAIGLSIIMIGAISTHARNGDPFSDSLEAFHLLVLLACILIVRLLGFRRNAAATHLKEEEITM